MGKVVVFGSLSQDLHLPLERHPSAGETVMSGDIEYRFGGKGANQAVAAARAGAESILVGKVGEDAQGREYLDRLARHGVDVSRVQSVPGVPTGTAIIYVDAAGENMIVVAPGANYRMGEEDLSSLDDLGAGDVLLMPAELKHDVVIAAAETAHSHGARVILNLAPFAALPQAVLELCDPVIVNEHEAADLADAGLEAPSVLVTLGPEGARWGEVAVPARPVTPVDTTGAGDVFCGTLAAALAAGEGRESAMRRAVEAAAACVLHHGAQPALPGD
ncbi:ribokinase [Bogoriella caseilytica]|uniref:Ribokinase n=1 Tax=Bogoriella caseilytica TaxID=56055 RepID=A0A3N2BB92_9MICO|nr:ribokinase [Bogoriella caseilytica]ROR72442.1 ribokinase [Bogoriella caseilytica]